MELINYKVDKIDKNFIRFRSCFNGTDFIYFTLHNVKKIYQYIRSWKDLKDMWFKFDDTNPLSNITYTDDSITIHSDVEGLDITFDTPYSKYETERGFDVTYWLLVNDKYETASYTYKLPRNKDEEIIKIC